MPVMNLDAFLAEVEEFSVTIPRSEVGKLHRVIAIEGLTRTVEKTPRDKGRAVGNWQVTHGSPAEGEIDREDTSDGGSQTINEEMPNAEASEAFTVTWITNNLSYIHVLEDGLFEPPNPGPSKDKRADRLGEVLVEDGYSRQAPEGMVKVTFQELIGMFP